MIVAVMSQPQRAHHCIAFFRQRPGQPGAVLLHDPLALSADDLPDSVDVIVVKGGGWRGVPTALMRSRLRRRLRDLSASGVQRAAVAERYGDRLLWDARFGSPKTHQHAVRTALEAHHAQIAITELVVFDVFDLPATLDVGRRHSIPVLVR